MGSNFEVIINNEWSNDEIKYIRESLISFNLATSPTAQNPISQTINLILKNNEGHVIGGLLGWMYRFCYYIDILWIDEKYRKFGHGTRLIKQIEELIKEKGCKLMHLDTFSFQTPDFYKKNGFEVFGVLDGYPEGICRYYLKKNI